MEQDHEVDLDQQSGLCLLEEVAIHRDVQIKYLMIKYEISDEQTKMFISVSLNLSVCPSAAVRPETRQCGCGVQNSPGGIFPLVPGVYGSTLLHFFFIISTCVCGAQ